MSTASGPAELPAPEHPSRLGARVRAVFGVLILVALVAAGWQLLRWEPMLLPIRFIQVEGEVHHHSSQQLQERLTARLRGGILTTDLRQLQQAAEELPWVGHATLRRVWPDTLRVAVEEYRPVARWNFDGLVTAEGVVFRPQGQTISPNLPLLEGDDRRAPEIMARYLAWRTQLDTVSQDIERLTVDARGDWRLKLSSGVELRLGTTQVEERLARYVASALELAAAGRPLLIDLRYSNGFSVKWAPNTETGVRAHPDRVAAHASRRG